MDSHERVAFTVKRLPRKKTFDGQRGTTNGPDMSNSHYGHGSGAEHARLLKWVWLKHAADLQHHPSRSNV